MYMSIHIYILVYAYTHSSTYIEHFDCRITPQRRRHFGQLGLELLRAEALLAGLDSKGSGLWLPLEVPEVDPKDACSFMAET